MNVGFLSYCIPCLGEGNNRAFKTKGIDADGAYVNIRRAVRDCMAAWGRVSSTIENVSLYS